MDLPSSLTPWREFLATLPSEVAVSLGPIIQRLDMAIGPLASGVRPGEGDPDGVNGISRRGSYERLLISEWLLAEEVPEEFTRRALTGEHSFLKLARLTPSAGGTSTVLFDAGPDQWGSPRIVQLAALIVLARRASAAGATFQWGLLQDPERSVCRSVDANALRLFLSDRRETPVTPVDVNEWLSDWPDLLSTGEAWLVGSPQMARWNGGRFSALAISDPLDPREERLEAAVEVKSRAPRTVSLPLPEDRICVRLLRDPYSAAVVAPQRSGGFNTPCSNLVFSYTGNKLFARSSSGGIIAYPIPNSARAGAGRPRHHQPRTPGTVVAVGRYYKATVILIAGEDPGTLTLEFVGGSQRLRGGQVSFKNSDFRVDRDSPLSPIVSGGRDDPAEFFALVNGLLIQIGNVTRSQSPIYGTIMASPVTSLAPMGYGLAWAFQRDGAWCVSTLHQGREQTRRVIEETGTQAYFGYGAGEDDPDFGLLASEGKNGVWHVHDRHGVRQLAPPRNTRVVGVVAAPGREEHPALIVVGPDQRNVNLLSRGWSQPLPPAPTEVLNVTASMMSPLIGYSTVEGEVLVYSLVEDAVIYRLKPSGEIA